MDREVNHIRARLWHRYPITVNQSIFILVLYTALRAMLYNSIYICIYIQYESHKSVCRIKTNIW
jgi:hypothetical protein